jgi:signal transduction histidine kinase
MAGKTTVLPVTQELIGRIGWFIRLRWFAVLGILVFVEAGRRFLPIEFHRGPLYVILAILALYNLLVTLAFRAMRSGRDAASAAPERRPPRPGAVARFFLPRLGPEAAYGPEAGRAALFAAAQIAVDLVILAALLHMSGGVENPLRAFFVFHVVIASLLLSRPATYLYATVGLGLYAAVALGEYAGVLPHYALHAHWRSTAYLEPGLVGTQVFLLGVILYVAAYLGSAISVHLRRRELDVVVLSDQLAEKAEHLETAYADLSAAERAKSQYMRKVAHELKGPLGTIRTALGVVLGAPAGAGAESVDLLRRAHRRAGELAVVTEELLSLARARGGATAVKLGRVSPSEVAARVLEEMRPRAEEKEVGLTERLVGGPSAIFGDAEGLADLMGNLLSNAIRYTPAGGCVEFRMAGEGESLVIVVSDTGIGIPAEDLPRIYDEFFRSKSARDAVAEGSGLGMAIVKAVVDAHGGTIAVESTVGRGTRVTVTLPPRQAEKASV